MSETKTEEVKGGRFASVPEEMKDESDVPAFLRKHRSETELAVEAESEIVTPFEIDDDSTAAARAAGRDVTASMPPPDGFSGSFSEACPACQQQHRNVIVKKGDDGNGFFECPITKKSIISTPDGLTLNPFEVDDEVPAVPLNDVGNRLLAAQIEERTKAEQMPRLEVEAAVRAPIKASYSQGTFNIIKTAKGRLTKCEERKDELRKLIEESQNELASLTTESTLLRDTIDRFESSSVDDVDFEDDDEDDDDKPVRRRKPAPKKKRRDAPKKPDKFLKNEERDDDYREPVE